MQACAGLCSSFTALGSTVTLANPPQPAAFSNLNASQIQANWTANNNPAGTLYKAILSSAPSPGNNGLSGNQTFSGTALSALFTGLKFSTTYYVDVQAANSAGTPAAFVSLGSTITLSPPAVIFVPKAPHNFLGQPQTGATQVTYRWDPVTAYSDDTPISVGTPIDYVVYTSQDPFTPLSGWTLASTIHTAGPGTAGPLTYGPVPAATSAFAAQYYQVCAVVLGVASDPCTPIANNFPDPNNPGETDYIYTDATNSAFVAVPPTEPILSGAITLVISLLPQNVAPGNGVLASVAVDAFFSNGASANPYVFPGATAVMPVQGTPLSVSAAGHSFVFTPEPTTAQTTLADNSSVALQSFAAGQWQTTGAATFSASINQLYFPLSRTGSYRAITYAAGAGTEGILLGVHPRTFSPNGDGLNDFVFFDLNNSGGEPMSGKIFDIHAADVSDIEILSPVRMRWNGKDRSGRAVPDGAYIYQIKVGETRVTGTVVVVK